MSDSKLNLIVQFSAVDKLGGALKNIIGLGRTGDQALRGLRGQARDLKGEMKGVQAEMAKATGNVSHLIDRERELEAAMARVTRQIERQKRINTIDAKVDRMKTRGSELKSSGRDNVIAGAGMLTPFVLASKAAMDFSSGMVDIQQKAALSNRETAQMARNILLMADAAHQLPEDMRAGVDTLAGLGLDPRQAIQMIAPIGRLGTAFKVDLADGASAAFANMNSLHVPINQTAAAIDIMAASGNRGAFEMRDMARWFPALTAQAAALGQKGTGAVADLAAALQIARQGTGDADTAANNVQNLLAKINAPGTISAFKKNFGIDLPSALRKAYAQGKTPLEAIAELSKKATGGDLSRLGFAFEDMQAQGALRMLILKMDEYQSIRAEIAKSGGTVDAAFRQREAQDASIAWKSFTGELSGLAITLGTTVLPAATRFIGSVNSMMTAVGSWARANPKAAGTLVSLIGYLALARVGLGVLQFAFGTILAPMATAWGWWAKFSAAGSMAEAFPVAARSLGILRTASVAAGSGLMTAGRWALAAGGRFLTAGAQWAVMAGRFILTQVAAAGSVLLGVGRAALVMGGNFLRAGLMMLANPMVLLVMAIALAVAGVAYLIWANWDRIKLAFTNGVAAVKGMLTALPAWMKSVGVMMMQGLLMALNPAILATRLLSIAKTGIAAFKNFFGIKSPSRLFMEMGGHMTAGLALGVDRGGAQPQRSISRMASRVAAAGALALAPPAFALPHPMRAPPPALHGLQPAEIVARAMRPAAMAPVARPGFAAPAAARTGPLIGELHIHQQPGEDAEALAERVMRKLEAAQRRGRRGSYGDDF